MEALPAQVELGQQVFAIARALIATAQDQLQAYIENTPTVYANIIRLRLDNVAEDRSIVVSLYSPRESIIHPCVTMCAREGQTTWTVLSLEGLLAASRSHFSAPRQGADAQGIHREASLADDPNIFGERLRTVDLIAKQIVETKLAERRLSTHQATPNLAP